ncbi:MAG: riboflavin biosynthesis protein RibD [Gammaproteobacteria bacterium RBG_16_51_14]|nr:MAG: riboflavin biosynthesis protein RibD [Gammaproteobacteria bacterium RBG_16_51_14]
MSRAIQLARRGLYSTDPNPRVGCVLVREDTIIAEGWHQRAGEPHAEIIALNHIGHVADGTTCYVTLEPCAHRGRTPPCTDALINANIERVIAAMVDPNPEVSGKGLETLQRAGIQVEHDLLSDQSRELNPGFIRRMESSMPYVRCKLAMSVDGRTALAGGESMWITSAEARADVQRLRARSSAIMTGIGTILIDDPALDVRGIETGGKQPLRVIMDTVLRTPCRAKMLNLPGRTLIFTKSHDRKKQQALQDAGAEIINLSDPGKLTWLQAVLQHLAVEEEVNELMLEAGATLCGSMLAGGLIDEIVIYMAPVLMGQNARPLFNLPAIQTMSDRIRLATCETRMIGKDLRITAKIDKIKTNQYMVNGN